MGQALDRLALAIDRIQAVDASPRVSERQGHADDRPPAPPEGAPLAAWSTLRVAPPDREALRQNLLHVQGSTITTPFDQLRTKLVQMARAKGWKRIAVTSPHEGCGKSMVLANLALSLSRLSDRRIVLWDCDLRRPRQAAQFGVLPRASVGSVLRREVPFGDQALRIRANLALSGNALPDDQPAETFLAPTSAEVLRQVELDLAPSLMLFDLPPMLSSDDAAAFLPMVDATILVAEADRTRLPDIDRCEREVAAISSVVGIVLNKCRMEAARPGYGPSPY